MLQESKKFVYWLFLAVSFLVVVSACVVVV